MIMEDCPYYLICPVCDGRVFERPTNKFYRYEEDVCMACGAHVRIQANTQDELHAVEFNPRERKNE